MRGGKERRGANRIEEERKGKEKRGRVKGRGGSERRGVEAK